jgi:hypothetical protein
MGKYTAQTAQGQLQQILRQNPNILDPLGPIVESAEFAQKEKKTALECIQKK